MVGGNKDKTIESYNVIAEQYSKTYGGSDDEEYVDRLLGYIAAGEKILDAGCGTGGVAKYIKDRGFCVEGIDLSSKMLEIAQKRTPDIRFRIMDFGKLEYSPETFAGIVSAWSLIHTPSKRIVEVLRGFNWVLKPGGYVLICVQKGEGEGYIPTPLDKSRKAFVHFFTKQELVKDLKEAGFEVVYQVEKPPTVELDWKGTMGFLYCISKKF